MPTTARQQPETPPFVLPSFEPDGTAARKRRLIACIDDGPGGHTAADRGFAGHRDGVRHAAGHGAAWRAPAPLDSDVNRSQVRDARAMLARAARDLNPPPDLRIAFGEPAERLIALAAREDAGAIVVPRPPGQPLKTALLGNVHLALAAAAPCPVLIVPPGAEPWDTTGEHLAGARAHEGDEPQIRISSFTLEKPQGDDVDPILRDKRDQAALVFDRDKRGQLHATSRAQGAKLTPLAAHVASWVSAAGASELFDRDNRALVKATPRGV
jgi:nucleotide-binding universal stress UspA family protein